MGTNYYVRVPVLKCPHCGGDTPEGFEDVHIGKLSGGWEFIFRGYKDDSTMPEISSIKDWLMFLDAKKIFDEYGVEYTITQFVDLVKDSRETWLVDGKVKHPQNHFKYCLEHHPRNMEDQWLDADGWSFNAREFS